MEILTTEFLALIARDLNLEIPINRIDYAVTVHLAWRPALEELRAIKLGYLDYVEPPGRQAWIERGGRS